KGRLELPAGGATVAEGGAEAPATHRSMTRERTAKDSAAGAPRGTSSSNFASSNFAYLSYHDPRLSEAATRAERVLGLDPVGALQHLRFFGELLARHV